MVSEPSKFTPDPKALVRLLPWAIFAIALLIRLIGIGWGLRNDLRHQSLHPDETDVFLYSQRVEPTKLNFTPGFYNYGTLYLTELRIASDMVTTYSGGPTQGDEESFWSWVGRCNLAGRVLSAVAGAILAVLAYLATLRAFGFVAGVWSGAIIALAPGLVIHSRFQTVDMTAAMWAGLALYAAFRLVPRDDEEPLTDRLALRWVAIGGVAAGLSGGTKYTGILAVLAVVTAAGLRKRPIEVAVAVAGALVAFVVATPGVMLDRAAFLRDFTYELGHSAAGHGLVFAETPSGFVYHLGNLAVGSSLLVVLLGVVGLGFCLASKNRFAWVMLAFAIPYYVAIGRGEVKFFRYAIPLFMPMAMFAGAAIVEARRRREAAGKVAIGVAILGVGGVPMGGLRGVADSTIKMTSTDPRDAAAKYLRTLGPITVGLARDPWFWSPSLFPDVVASRMTPWSKRLEAMNRDSRPKAIHMLDADGKPTLFDERLVTEAKPDYIVYSSFEYGPAERLFATSTEPEVAQVKKFKAALDANYTLDSSFGAGLYAVEDLQYVQPTLWIWKRKSKP